MFRIDNASSSASLPTPGPVGPNPNGYWDVNTIVTSDALNAIQEEICYVIEQQSITLSKTDRTQLKAAIEAMIAAQSGFVSASIIQGSVDDDSSTTPGYIDSTDIAEDDAGENGIISYSIDDAALATTSNWSSILPITIASNVKRTIMRSHSFIVGASSASEENHNSGVINIDWDNSRVNGYIMGIFGQGYPLQTCYRFSGTIGAGDTDFTGTLQNGSYASGGAAPTFRINGTNKTIVRLPMIGTMRNVGFELNNYS
jgi:hypothetical protein